VIWLLVILAAAYGLLLLTMWKYQRQLMYHPDTAILAPEAYGLEPFEEHFAVTDDGIRIQCWLYRPKEGYPLVIYFHGNAGNLGNRAGIYGALAEKGFGVLAVSYRGYGKSEGSPTEAGLYADARAMLRLAREMTGTPMQRMILYGESLGTGVAVQMAMENPPGGLILQAPYTSVSNRGAELYPFMPVRFLVEDVYDSLSKIGRVRTPLLLLHGERDETIPTVHGRTLFASAADPKQAIYFPDVAHNDFDSQVISEHVLAFARAHGLIASSHASP